MSRRGIICDLLASSGGVAPVVMSFSGEQSCVYSKEGVISLQRLSNYLSLYLERVLDCCGAFVSRVIELLLTFKSGLGASTEK